jgi:hypothetical protein
MRNNVERLGEHVTAARVVIHSGPRSWEGPQPSRCQTSVSTVNDARITGIW